MGRTGLVEKKYALMTNFHILTSFHLFKTAPVAARATVMRCSCLIPYGLGNVI